MNRCFLIGKIISKVEFQFMLDNKKISISKFILQVNNEKIIIKSHNKIADKCYNKLNKNNIVAIEGELDSKMEVIANEIYIL